MRRKLAFVAFVALGLAVGLGGCSAAGKYPEKSVTMVIPFPAGGSTDIFGRRLADQLKAPLGQPVVVENRTTAAAMGISEILGGKADGYTIGLVTDSYLTISPNMADVPYKGPGDAALVAMMYHQPVLLVVNPDSPWKTVKDLMDAGRATPGKIRVADGPLGNVNHIDTLELMDMTKSQLTYVPFGGGAQALADFLGGHVESLVVTPAEVKPHVDAGKARPLGIFAEKRSPIFPDVPTMKEQGFDITRELNGVIFGPKALPDNVKSALQEGLKKVAADPQLVADILKTTGLEVSYLGPEETTKRLAADYDKAKALVDRLGLRQK